MSSSYSIMQSQRYLQFLTVFAEYHKPKLCFYGAVDFFSEPFEVGNKESFINNNNPEKFFRRSIRSLLVSISNVVFQVRVIN